MHSRLFLGTAVVAMGAISGREPVRAVVDCQRECVAIRIESTGLRPVRVVVQSPRKGVHLPAADSSGTLEITTPATIEVPRTVDRFSVTTNREGVRIFFEAGSTPSERRQIVWGTSITLVRQDSGFAPIARFHNATPSSD